MVYLQCPGFLALFFKKLEWPLLYTHWEGLIHFIMETTSMSTNVGKQKGPPDQKSNLETCLTLSTEVLSLKCLQSK